MAQEIELKLAFPARARKSLQNRLIVLGGRRQGSAVTLVNTYFDTPDMALGQARVALRTRKAGRLHLQTVKCAAASLGGLSSRPEWEQAYAGEFDFSAVAEAPRALLEKHRAAIIPLFLTDFRRESYVLEPAAGVRILAMVDIGSIHAAGREERICELELELDSGAAGDLWALAIALASDLPLIPYDPSKAERGYRLFRNEAVKPARAQPSPITAGLSPVAAFRSLAFQLLHDWQANTFGALYLDSPDFVHQMRVALRRLRTLIKVFAKVLPQTFVSHWSDALAGLAGGVGEARDLEVLMIGVLKPLMSENDDEGLQALVQCCEAARHKARESARRTLQQRNCGEALLRFARDLHGLPEPEDGPLLLAYAHANLRKLARRQKARLRETQADSTPEALHQLRIGFKRLRYTLEFFAPLCRPKLTTSFLRQLSQLQDELGHLHDLDMAQSYFETWGVRSVKLRDTAAYVRGWHAPKALDVRKSVLTRATALFETKSPWRKLSRRASAHVHGET